MTLQPVPAHILSITPETPTIARITLRIDDGAPFAFVPGQWIDFGVQLGDQLEVGGYSLASAPAQLPDIELGVRHNPRHTVSHWLHTEAKPGDTVLVQGGQGNCVWTPTRDDEVIFVVGGIGITPPLSMLRAALATTTPFQARMHYSARTHDELAFLTDLQKLAADPRFVLHTTVTRETPENNDRRGRWTATDVLASSSPKAIVYVFGPPPMVDGFCTGLAEAGLASEQIRTERWW